MRIQMCFMWYMLWQVQIAAACPICDKRQPKATQGFTHGTGPQSNWDWVIISIVVAITLVTLVLSVKHLVRPGETDAGHIKQSLLSN